MRASRGFAATALLTAILALPLGCWIGAACGWPTRGLQAGFFVASIGWLYATLRIQQKPPLGSGLVLAAWIAALASRAALLPLPPSDDVHRYVWEGRVALAGHNPYLHAPDAPELAALRDEHWAGINNRDHRAIYPPTAQILFMGGALLTHDPAQFKLLLTGAELAALGLLWAWRRRAGCGQQALIYALCPIPMLAIAREGHLEGLTVFGLALWLWASERRGQWTRGAVLGGVGLGLAIGTKVVPLLLVPWWLSRLLREEAPMGVDSRRQWAAGFRCGLGLAALLAVLLLPAAAYWNAGVEMVAPLRNFATEFHNLDATRQWLRAALGASVAEALIRATVVGLALTAGLWARGAAPALLWVVGAALILAPTLHPWYGVWVAPALPATPHGLWLALLVLLGLAYEGDAQRDAGGVWSMPLWVGSTIHGAFYCCAVALLARRQLCGRHVAASKAPPADEPGHHSE